MRVHKTLHDLILVNQLNEEDVPCSYSNVVQRVTKRAPDPDYADASKYKHIWYLKYLNDAEDAAAEVAAQEIFRLILPRHPKTRLIESNDGKLEYVMSREIAGEFINLDALSEEERRQNFLKRAYNGLGEIMVVSLFVNEWDLRFGNLFVNDKNELIKIDGNRCFFGDDGEISAADLDRLPFIRDYGTFNWLDMRARDINSESKTFNKRDSYKRQLRLEINETLCKIILLPPGLLRRFVDAYPIRKDMRDDLYERIISRQKRLCGAALENRSFRKYIISLNAEQDLEKYIEQLQAFHPLGKADLKMKKHEQPIRDKFTAMDKDIREQDLRKRKTNLSSQFIWQHPVSKQNAKYKIEKQKPRPASPSPVSFWSQMADGIADGVEKCTYWLRF